MEIRCEKILISAARLNKLDGKLYEGYFPAEGEPETIDIVPGIHASADFLAYLAFNSYVLDTPAYRELQRMFAEKMRVSRMTLHNWLHKGSFFVSQVVKTLKDICLAHARAKFEYAAEQGDRDAEEVVNIIRELYKLEAEYKAGRLSAEQIGNCRQSLKTKEIVIRLRSKLDTLLSENHSPRGELMNKSVNYLNIFWKQIFTYLKDGNYDIDNTLAERMIRPLAGQRKNSLFFGSHKKEGVSATFHAQISTCRMHGVPALEYLKKFFREIVNGNRDYHRTRLNFLPNS